MNKAPDGIDSMGKSDHRGARSPLDLTRGDEPIQSPACGSDYGGSLHHKTKAILCIESVKIVTIQNNTIKFKLKMAGRKIGKSKKR